MDDAAHHKPSYQPGGQPMFIHIISIHTYITYIQTYIQTYRTYVQRNIYVVWYIHTYFLTYLTYGATWLF
jgi:hypothetical protein